MIFGGIEDSSSCLVEIPPKPKFHRRGGRENPVLGGILGFSRKKMSTDPLMAIFGSRKKIRAT
jgi:hypothetical protein